MGISCWIDNRISRIFRTCMTLRRIMPLATPTPTIIISAYATYNLPVGRGQRFGANMNSAVNQVVGGWQASTIVYHAHRLPARHLW